MICRFLQQIFLLKLVFNLLVLQMQQWVLSLLIIMESHRMANSDNNNHRRISACIVFIGFLLTSSLLFFAPFPHSMLTLVPVEAWAAIVAAVFLATAFGFIAYFFTPFCSFTLEVAQYLLVPVSAISLIQILSYYQNNATPTIFTLTVCACIMAGLTVVMMGLKVLCINQTFPGEPQLQILQFSTTPRIFRLLKVIINCCAVALLGSSDATIFSIVLNCLDAVIIFKRIVFVDVHNQSAALLASTNNLLSLCFCSSSSVVFLNFSWQNILSELILTIVFFTFSHPVRLYQQLRYTAVLESSELSKSNLQHSQSKKKMVLLLSCLSNVFRLGNPHLPTLTQRKSRDSPQKNFWSPTFMCMLNKTYQIALYSYRMEKSQSQKSIENIEGSEIRNKMEQLYSKIWGSAPSVPLLESKSLFYNFVAMCIQKFENVEQSNWKWDFMSQFLVVYSTRLNANFLMKHTVNYYKRLHRCTQMVEVARNSKTKQYLKFYELEFKTKPGTQQRFMELEHRLANLKRCLEQACENQIKFVEKLAISSDCSSYGKMVASRQKDKQAVFDQFKICFELDSYLEFQQFTYLYLMFMVIFCKSIYQTSQNIRKKFMIPKVNANKDRLTQINTCQVAVLVCLGQQTANKNFGQLVMANSNFCKTFGLQSNDFTQNVAKVSDLFLSVSQKNKHINLMTQSCRFLQNIEPKTNHSQHQCLIKINLESVNLHVAQKFKVSTRVFHGFVENLLFLCTLKPINEDRYILQSESSKLLPKASLMLPRNKHTHRQLDQQIAIMLIEPVQLLTIGFARDREFESNSEEGKSVNHSVSAFNNCKHEQDASKFAKIQQILWAKVPKPDYFMLKQMSQACLSMLIIIGTALSLLIWCETALAQSQSIVEVQQNMIVSLQGSPMHAALALDLIKNIRNGAINNQICSPVIQDLQSFCINDSKRWSIENIKNYYTTYGRNEVNLAPMLDPSYLSQISQGRPNTYSMDYWDYLFQNVAKLGYYSQLDYSKDYATNKQINDFILEQLDTGSQSKSSNFLNSITSKSEQLLNSFKFSVGIFYIAAATMTVLGSILLLLALFKMYVHVAKYFNLLYQIDISYLYQRMQEMKFILKQIRLIRDSNFEKCELISQSEAELHIISSGGTMLQTTEFQKFIQAHQQSISLEVSPSTRDQSSIRSVLKLKKGVLIVTVVVLLFYLGCCIYIGTGTSSVITKKLAFSQVLYEGQKTRESIFSLVTVNWLAYLKEDIRSAAENERIFGQAKIKAEMKKLITLMVTEFDQSILNKTVHLSLCAMLQQSGDKEYVKTCGNQIEGYSSLKLTELLTVIIKNQYMIWKGKDSIADTIKLCSDTRIVMEQLEPAMLRLWSVLRTCLNENASAIIKQFWFVLCCSAPLFLIILAREITTTYWNLINVIKFQVFTMDTPQDLHANSNFRPHLNKAIYHSQHSGL